MSGRTDDPEHDAVADGSPVDEHPTTVPADDEHQAGVTFWVAMAVGALAVVGGLRGLFMSDVRWIRSMGAWFVAGGVLADLAIVPVIALVGLAGQRLLPPWAWRVIRGALLVSLALVAFSWVLVAEPGGRSPNPSVRPRNYDQGLLVYLIAVWVLAGLGLIASWFLDRREASVL